MFGILQAVMRKFTQSKGTKGEVELRLTGLESLAVAQVELFKEEKTRAGLGFQLSAMNSTGIAPVQAIPSSAAQWLIYNPTANQTTAFLDTLGEALVSGTSGAGGTLYGCIVKPSQLPSTVPSASAANVSIKNKNSASAKGSQLICASGQTLQNATAADWFPVAFYVGNPAMTLVAQTQCELRGIVGAYCVPPGCGFALAMVSPTGSTPLFAPYAEWFENISDLE